MTSLQRLDLRATQITDTGLIGVAPPTVDRFVARVNRLYEQGASLQCIGQYVRRWCKWVVSGLGEFAQAFLLSPPTQLLRVYQRRLD